MFDRIVKLSIDNSVFVNLVFIAVFVIGLIAAFMLPREEFPEVTLDRVIVTVAYPGATAADVEELITKPIEDALEDVADVDEVRSTSQEGSCAVTIDFLEGTDLTSARSEVEKAVASVDDLPADAETPIVKELVLELPVVSVALLGDPSATKLVEELSDELRKLDGVSTINVTGVAHAKIFVDLDERKLRALRIQPAQVAAAIQNAQATMPAGSVELQGQDIFVKTEKRIESAADVAATPLSPGSSLRIGDIADVKAVADPDDTLVWVDGRPAVKLTVGREKTADPISIRDDTTERVAQLQTEIPPGLGLVVADDYTTTIDDRLDVVAVNAIGGGVLVILVLLVMSGFRQALLAVWGMPISFLVATALMLGTGLTINVVSTFGLLIAIGIIVDDAIVVIENVQRHIEMGKVRRQAVIDGTREVLVPVTVAIATTCIAFSPLTMVSGVMGRIMKILPLVVIFCLLGSLFEAIFILPGHMNHYASKNKKDSRTARLAAAMQRIYRVPLRWTVHHPLLTLLLVTLGFAGSGALAASMPFQVNAPAKPFDLLVYYETMPGLDKAHTQEQGEAINALVHERLGENVRSTTLRVGSYLDRQRGQFRTGSNVAKLRWEFEYDEEFRGDYVATVRELRRYLASNPDLGMHFIREKTAGPPAGAAVTANVRGRDIDQINSAVAEIKSVLYEMPGVSDIRDTYGSGKETFRVRVDQDRASRFGLTERDVATAVRSAIDGLTALEVSIDEEKVDIVVRYAGGQSRGKERLADLVIATAAGDFVRLDQVATLERTREVSVVQREDNMRTVAVEADLDTEVNSPLQAAADLEERWNEGLADRYTGLSLTFGGEGDEIVKSLEDLKILFPMAIIAIYLVLALQFKSYLQPVIILSAVPFGLMGAVFGLAALNYDLTIFAMFGMVALAGIVVNDSLVMIDFINKRRESGLSPQEAAIEGALHRLRPIVSTTLTTCLGLLPMAIGLGGRDDVLAPMAVAISGGLAVATGLVLLVVPAIYVIIERLRPRRSADPG